VDGDLENQQCSDELKEWLKEKLLPAVYWKQQIKKSRSSKALKAYYLDLQEKVKKALYADPLTQKYGAPHWGSWAKERAFI